MAKYAVVWQMQVRPEPGSTVMESPVWEGSCVANDGAPAEGLAKLVAEQFYETVCEKLGVGKPLDRFLSDLDLKLSDLLGIPQSDLHEYLEKETLRVAQKELERN